MYKTLHTTGAEEGETYESFCRGTGTLWGDTFQQMVDYSFSEEELTYFAENNIIIAQEERIAITDYDASCGTDVIIPKTINGYPVTMITTTDGNNIPTQISDKTNNNHYSNALNYKNKGYNVSKLASPVVGAFEDKGLKSVIIPDSVISIGEQAFQNNQLTSVVIPDSVTSIEWGAFSSNQLTSVVIPDSVISIEDYAFQNNQLTSVVIPDSVISIEDYAFQNNQLTSVVIPDSVISIGDYAFSNNQLTSVAIENGVEEINDSAFINNNLTAVAIPDSVTYLSCWAFDDTVEITKRGDLVCDATVT